ncbi:hematopoietic cell signal transducer-like [Pseudophryne corroboree]|uniref:hematopoietic cell signal transducer-like n=1 Tax=Pseudophryne corroboree TaxID=495146 RepID=UPI0030812CAF
MSHFLEADCVSLVPLCSVLGGKTITTCDILFNEQNAEEGGGRLAERTGRSDTMKGTSQQGILYWYLLWLPMAFAASPEAELTCGDCYRIDTVTLVGVIVGDIALTIVIILVVYFCTKQSFKKRAENEDKKVYMNMPSR